MQPPPFELDSFDPYRLVFHMTLVSVFISSIGMSITTLLMFQKLSFSLFTVNIDILGDYLQSPLAIIYNISLLLTGCCFILAMISLIFLRLHALCQAIAYVGILAGVSIMLLGLFPVNDTFPHQMAMLIFHIATGVFFGLLLISRRLDPNWCHPFLSITSLIGLLCVLALSFHFDLNKLSFIQMDQPYLWVSMGSLTWIHAMMTIFTGLGLALAVHRLMLERYNVNLKL
ncbi:MAG: hypothetical protein ACRCT7_17175 [Shewanella sp.]